MGLDELEQLIQLLLDNGVAEFEGEGVRLKFRDTVAPHNSEHEGVDADPHRAQRKAEAKSQWHHPSLWGSLGAPPSFDKDK